MGKAYADDPLIWHGPFKRPTLEALVGFLTTITEAGELGDLPTMWIHGDDDHLVEIDGTREGIARLRGRRYTERSFPSGRHELFNETNRDEVLASVRTFIDAVIRPAPGAAST